MKLKHYFTVASALFLLSCTTVGDAVTTNKDAITTIHSRKSVRTYTDQSVDRAILTDIVKAGMAAPSGMDRRPWEFVIVDNREILDKLSEGSPYAKMLLTAPAAIIVCGNMDEATGGSFYWYLDCSAAAQNILLATEAMGLGGTWTAAYPYEERMNIIREAVNLPSNIGALCVIPIGYPTGKEMPKNKYNEAKIHINKW